MISPSVQSLHVSPPIIYSINKPPQNPIYLLPTASLSLLPVPTAITTGGCTTYRTNIAPSDRNSMSPGARDESEGFFKSLAAPFTGRGKSREPSPARPVSSHAALGTPLAPNTSVPSNVAPEPPAKERGKLLRIFPFGRDKPPREAGQTSSTRASSPAPSTPALAAGMQSLNLHPPLAPAPPRNQAFERALGRLSGEDKAAFQSASAVDVIEELKKAQQGASRISDSLSGGQKALECMNRFMRPLAIFIQHSPEISSLVVGGLKCILMVCILQSLLPITSDVNTILVGTAWPGVH